MTTTTTNFEQDNNNHNNQYTLNSSSSSSIIKMNKNHSIVFVKLTDSALKAIEDYALTISSSSSKGNLLLSNNNNNKIKKPLIELQSSSTTTTTTNGNTQGIITIPNINNTNNENHQQQFNFSLKDLQNDGSILECVRQQQQQQQQKLRIESLGKIMFRMQIHANDDVYQTTKVKMANAVEQESKKYNTKVIEINGNRKLKSKLKPISKLINNNENLNINKNSSTVSFNKFNSNTVVQSTATANKITAEHLHKIRDILIQLLNTKLYNRPIELIPKVQERFKEFPVDRQQIIKILNKIATYKEGEYQLNNELNDHQQQHLENENNNNNNNNSSSSKISITVNHQYDNSLISPNSDYSVKSLSSPCGSLTTSPCTNVKSVKRGVDNDAGTANHKKFKSDAINRQVLAKAKSISPFQFDNSKPQLHHQHINNSMHSTPNSSPDSLDILNTSGGNNGGSDSSQNNDNDDYLSKYSKIKEFNQLQQYRNDFEMEYPEYKKLFDYVEMVAGQFEELKERIQTKEEESEEWHDLIRQIFDKYDEVKKRSKYQLSQKRLIYLHYKLLHIKNQIQEYLSNNKNLINSGNDNVGNVNDNDINNNNIDDDFIQNDNDNINGNKNNDNDNVDDVNIDNDKRQSINT